MHMARAARAYSARSAMYERVLQPIRPKRKCGIPKPFLLRSENILSFSRACAIGDGSENYKLSSMTGTLIEKEKFGRRASSPGNAKHPQAQARPTSQ